MQYLNRSFSFLMILLAVGMLASCAQYQVSSNRVNSYDGHIERLAIWSSVKNVQLLSVARGFYTKAFTDRFNLALKQKFQNEGISADVHEFTSNTFNKEIVGSLEQEFQPNSRLLIQPTRYHITTYQGSPIVSALWLDLSLNDVATDKLIWHGTIFLDPGLDPNTWIDSGANNLASKIVDAIKKDELISFKQPAP